MSAATHTVPRHDGRLWALALGLSLVVNAGLAVLAAVTLDQWEKHQPPVTRSAPPPAEIVERIQITAAPPAEESASTALVPVPEPPPPPPDLDKEFARTSPDQAADRPEHATHIGELDTRATSDAPPVADAPLRPSQSGVDPLHPDHIETTESKYRDGMLADAAPDTPPDPTPPEPAPAPPAAAAPGMETPTPGTSDTAASPPPTERLRDGPNPVEVAVPATEDTPPTPKPGPKALPKPGVVAPADSPAQANTPRRDTPKPTPVPAFRGNQHKTVLRGRLDRTGRSALDVENTPLGRYQAALGRAVELEWQRNCVRYRDFITPGFLTVRFFVNAKGKVQSVAFDGSMKAGEQQKGFTLNSIRDAEIPPMPPELAREFKDENLELIFNFYF